MAAGTITNSLSQNNALGILSPCASDGEGFMAWAPMLLKNALAVACEGDAEKYAHEKLYKNQGLLSKGRFSRL